ncbi:hypothetical protein GCM10027406_13650 [Leifsonia lichenia]
MPPMESPAHHPSRRTLLVGGAGIVLGTVIPLITQALFLMQLPGTSWLSAVETPVLGTWSAVILIVAFVVLAVGIGGEPGIAGRSVVGRAALIVFGAASLATAGYSTWAALSVETSAGLVTLVGVLEVSLTALWLAALIVGSIFVVRAGVVRGVARWGLAVLAALTVLDLLASRIPLPAAVGVWIWGFVALRAVQLLIGVLFIVQALAVAPRQDAAFGSGYAR